MGRLSLDNSQVFDPEYQDKMLGSLIDEVNNAQEGSDLLNSLPIAMYGRLLVTGTLNPGGTNVGRVHHGLGYTPLFVAYLDKFNDGSVYINLPHLVMQPGPPTQDIRKYVARITSQDLEMGVFCSNLFTAAPNSTLTFFFYIFAIPMPT